MQSEDKEDSDNSSQIEHIKISLEELQKGHHQIHEDNIRLQNKNASQTSEIKTRITDLQRQLDQLSSQLTVAESRADLREEEKAVKDYLIAEFNTLQGLWKHTDSRIEASIRFYLTVSTIITSSAVFLFQYQSAKQLFVPTSLSIAIASFIITIAGFFLTVRVTSSAINKSKYIYSMDLIRDFFVEKKPEIAPYVYMLTDAEKISAAGSVEAPNLKVIYRSSLFIGTINTLSSAALGVGTASFIHFCSSATPFLVKLLLGSAIGMASLLAISIFLRGRLKSSLKTRLERHNRQLSH